MLASWGLCLLPSSAGALDGGVCMFSLRVSPLAGISQELVCQGWER